MTFPVSWWTDDKNYHDRHGREPLSSPHSFVCDTGSFNHKRGGTKYLADLSASLARAWLLSFSAIAW